MQSRYPSIPNSPLIVFLILFLCICSCTERIDIKTENAPSRLAIYGFLTTDTMAHSIRITRSAGYFDTHRPQGIGNALVSISTDDNIFTLTENDALPGLYQTAPDVYGIEGKTYTLDVSLDFDGDGIPEKYESSSILPFIGHIDSIVIEPSEVIKDFLQVLLYAQDPVGENFYSMHISRNDTLANDSLMGFFIMDDQFFDGLYMDGVPCFFLDQKKPENKLREGDRITLCIDAINKNYATFISDCQNEVHGPIPFFGGPPANVTTNIRCTSPPDAVVTAGFFTAYPSQRKSTVYRKKQNE